MSGVSVLSPCGDIALAWAPGLSCPSGGAAACASSCPAAAVCAEGQDALLAPGTAVHSSPLPGLLLLPPYGAVGKDVSRADPSFTPQLFLPVHLNSKRNAEKREDAALCLWSTSLGFAWALWCCSKGIPQERSHAGDKSLCPRLLEMGRGAERKHFALPFIFRAAVFVGWELWAAQGRFSP